MLSSGGWRVLVKQIDGEGDVGRGRVGDGGTWSCKGGRRGLGKG